MFMFVPITRDLSRSAVYGNASKHEIAPSKTARDQKVAGSNPAPATRKARKCGSFREKGQTGPGFRCRPGIYLPHDVGPVTMERSAAEEFHCYEIVGAPEAPGGPGPISESSARPR
jgi:hypothetical protein